MFKEYNDYQGLNTRTEEESNVGYQNELPRYLVMTGQDEEKDIAESMSQLVLDDDMDDPAIMNISRSRMPIVSARSHSRELNTSGKLMFLGCGCNYNILDFQKTDGRLHYAVSPPPPAIVETDIVVCLI